MTRECLQKKAERVLKDKDPWWINNWWPNQINEFMKYYKDTPDDE